MKKKVLMIILIVVINVLFFNINVVQADGLSDVISGGDSFLDASEGMTTIDEDKLQDASKTIYNILLVLGICVAVIVAAILGIKFMIGSMEEKAQVKEALIPFVIGCVVVFGAFGIWKIFVAIGNDVSDENQLNIAINYVRGEDGNLYKKGELYCKNCKDSIEASEFSNGRCTHCYSNTWSSKCSCGYQLTKSLLTSEDSKCPRCGARASITTIRNNSFIYYSK